MRTVTVDIPKLSVSPEENLSLWALVAILLLSVIYTRAHEYSHIISVVLQGCAFTSGFGWVSPYGDNRVVSTLAGPLLTYIVMWIGLALLLKSRNGKRAGFELIFASLPLFRMAGHMFSTFPGRDELGISRALHIADPYAAAIVWAIVLPPLVFAYVSIDSRVRAAWFLFYFVVLPFMSAIVVSVLGDSLIMSLVKSHRLAGTPVASSFHGIPVVVLLCDAAVVTSFLLVGRLNRQSTEP